MGQSEQPPRAMPVQAMRSPASESAHAALLDAYEAHQRQLHTYLLATTRDPGTAADLLQETFVRYLREAQAGRIPLSPRAWLYRVATNLANSHGRRRRSAARWMERQSPYPATVDSAEDEIVRRERSRLLMDSLEDLPDEARAALLMASHGFSGAEIALAIGRTESATRTLMCRARLRLRNRLADEGAEE
ncbi:MAG: RNA polymerase sigma factor [Candidatus Limnocylindria bacterium]